MTTPVDKQHLRAFTHGDPKEEQELITLFIEQIRENLLALKEHIASQHQEKWCSIAHRFAGSAGTFGARQLHVLCRKAEHYGAHEEAKKQQILTLLDQEVNQVITFLGQS